MGAALPVLDRFVYRCLNSADCLFDLWHDTNLTRSKHGSVRLV
jgi:hypothetical protein